VKYLKKYEGPTNKFKKNYEFFLKFSDIIKGLISSTIKTNRNKINGIDIKMYFGKCILDLKLIGQVGPKGQAQASISFVLG